MTLDDYNALCASQPHAHHVVQWGGAHVWKVGGIEPHGANGKVFTIASQPAGGDALHVTFKCSAASFDMLGEMPGCRPAPYLASRGMLWIQRTGSQTLDDAALADYVQESWRLAALGLTRRRRREIGLDL